MNEFDQTLGELAEIESDSQTTEFANHFRTNICNHCDLFETSFYKDFWHSFHDTDNLIIGSALERLTSSVGL